MRFAYALPPLECVRVSGVSEMETNVKTKEEKKDKTILTAAGTADVSARTEWDKTKPALAVFEVADDDGPDEDGVFIGTETGTTSVRVARDDEEAPDSVKAYLHEIGRVKLLTFKDEQRLARQMEEDEALAGRAARIQPTTDAELHAALVAELKALAPVAELALELTRVSGGVEAIDDARVRDLIDKTPDETLVARVAEALAVDTATATQRVIDLSVVSRLLPASLRDEGVPAAAVSAHFRAVRRNGQEAERQLTQANLRLVVSVAKKYLGRGLTLLDMIQEGNLGLMRAVQKFEYRRGFKFSTDATWWIRQSITRAIADHGRTIRMPVHMVELVNKLQRTSRRLVQEYGREPTFAEIGKELDLPAERVEEVLRSSQETVSLETPVGDDEESQLADFVQDEDAVAPAEAATRNLMRVHLNKALAALPEREQRVLALRFGLEDGRARTLEEVGREMGVTRERIRQIEAKALRTLRHPTHSHVLKDFLD